MRNRYQQTIGIAVFALAWSLNLASADATVIRMSTTLGDIDVRMYVTLAPNSVANFLNYASTNRYDDTFIHRVPQSDGESSNFVVQGGGFKLNNSIFSASGIVTDAPIGNEFNVSNQRGTLAMAKNSLGATSQWFYNLGNNAFLDNDDFTVVGRVLGDGMDVIDAINALDTINAAVAETIGTGEDFDEVPVLNLQKVVDQNDIRDDDAVIISDVSILGLPAGDYNFDGVVDAADYTVWRDTQNSTTLAEADGNGDGVVDNSDLTIWENTFGQTTSSFSTAIPEPAAAILLAISALVGFSRRRHA